MRVLLAAMVALAALGCAETGVYPQRLHPFSGPPNPLSAPAELPAVAAEPRKAGAIEMSGLEASDGWFSEDWGNPVDVSRGQSAELGDFLKLEVKGGDKDKSAAGFAVLGAYGEREKGLRMDFQNPGRAPVNVAVGLFTGPGRKYYESPVVVVQPGWSSHGFNVTAAQWKTRESGWQYTEAPGTATVVQLDIIVYDKNPVTLYVTYVSPPTPVQQMAPEPVGKAEPTGQRPALPAVSGTQPVTPKPPSPVPPRQETAPGPLLSPEEETRLGKKLTADDKAEILRVLKSLED